MSHWNQRLPHIRCKKFSSKEPEGNIFVFSPVGEGDHVEHRKSFASSLPLLHLLGPVHVATGLNGDGNGAKEEEHGGDSHSVGHGRQHELVKRGKCGAGFLSGRPLQQSCGTNPCRLPASPSYSSKFCFAIGKYGSKKMLWALIRAWFPKRYIWPLSLDRFFFRGCSSESLWIPNSIAERT